MEISSEESNQNKIAKVKYHNYSKEEIIEIIKELEETSINSVNKKYGIGKSIKTNY